MNRLLFSRRLGPLCLTQTCGAFNDNLVKNAMVVLAIFKLGAGGAGLAALAGALFIAPVRPAVRDRRPTGGSFRQIAADPGNQGGRGRC